MPSRSRPPTGGGSRSPRSRSAFGSFLADHKGITAASILVILAVVVVVAGKLLADRSATEQTEQRADEVRELLRHTTPEDFLALNAERGDPDEVARAVREEPDFVNVEATAQRSVIRFQPDGWWAGFTERCVLAVVTEDGVRVSVPKTACVRAEPG